MFDESGSNYRPVPIPKPKPTAPVTPPEPNQIAPQQLERLLEILRQSWWVRATIYYLMIVCVLRFISVRGDSISQIIAQLASVTLLAVMITGLSGMRRWGAWLLIIYAVGSMISAWVEGSYHIYLTETTVDGSFYRTGMIFSELLRIGLVTVFYGFIAAWYWYHIQSFLPVQAHPGLYLGLVAVIILYTAVQMTFAPADVQRTEEELIRQNSGESWLP